MRINGTSKSNTADGANIGDLMSRLSTGDVIRAKVIEITSDEAILRLFDGTSLKAKLAEELDAKAGQTITLSVASKTEGTLVLETVKNFNARFEIKPDVLKNILEALQLKLDNKNTEAAAEMLKAGLPVTKEAIGKVLQLMDASKDMTAERAVFISSKVTDGSRVDPELAARLLKGELKLGKLITELQNAVEKVNENSGSEVFSSKNTGTAPDASQSRPVQSTASFHAHPGATNISALNTQDEITSGSAANRINTGESGPGNGASSQQTAASAKTVQNSSFLPQDNSGRSELISQGKAAPNASQAISGNNRDSAQDELLAFKANNDVASYGSAGARTADSSYDNTDVYKNNILIKSSFGGIPIDENENGHAPGQTDNEAAPLSKIRDAIKDIFVGTDSDKLASELDAVKLYKELDTRLETVKKAVHSPEIQGAKADMISGAVNLLGDTLRLFDQLNSGGLMYYQIPVKIADNNTTAELYIMKKQRNGKKIDPGNTVMFISLDTVNMGRVETLIDVRNRNVSIQLRTESQGISDYIKEYTKDLYNGLSELGYKLTGIRFKTIDTAADPLVQEKLLEELKQGYVGKVDFRV